MQLINLKIYTPPGNPPFGNATYLIDENSLDWYASQHLFTKLWKLAINPVDGTVLWIESDITRLAPSNMSVVEVDTLPNGVDTSGAWYFNGNEVVSKVVDTKLLARSVRNSFIASSDPLTITDFAIEDAPLSDEQRADLLATRQAFRTWPLEPGWPEIPVPVIPQWIRNELEARGWVLPVWPLP